MTTILLVDDDKSLVRALSIGLGAFGYLVEVATNGVEAITSAARVLPDLLLVDLGLPELSGIEVITAIRAWSDVPIIVLSARPQEAVKVAALDAGADDYLTKPFGINELLARIRASLRRSSRADEESVVRAGELTIDLAARLVLRGDVAVHLTPKEWGALAVLVRNRGRLVSQQALLEQVWGPGYSGESEYLRTLFSRLRKKLENDPASPVHLITEPGVGYRFEIGAVIAE
ncbi:MAG: response regulator [Acidimicrobiaceae bacterium]|nr:response regulator [Acidimicrobiaceae bacterium]